MALRGDLTRTIMMACEVMHGASLLHDDIEDRDGVRWGRPTVDSLFGADRAINVGDGLIGLVYRLILGLRTHGVREGAVLDVLQVFNETHVRMCEGQHLDLTFRYCDGIGVGEYVAMISRKTAAPCECIAEAISILTECPTGTRRELRDFGHALGMLYQVCDDIRGIWSDPDALGRPAGQDVWLGRPTLPLIYGFERGSEGLRSLLRERGAHPDGIPPEALVVIRRELERAGVKELCLRDARRYFGEARDAMRRLGRDCRESHVLQGILDACVASVGLGMPAGRPAWNGARAAAAARRTVPSAPDPAPGAGPGR
jgi:geranylgeranyl pyrophosphate synthase